MRRRTHFSTRKLISVVGLTTLFFVVSMYLPAPEINSSQIVTVNIDGETEEILIFGDQGCGLDLISIFAPFNVSAAGGHWDCKCTNWKKDPCGPQTSYTYHEGKLVATHISSCIGGVDQNNKPCKGCCFRTDCTWIPPVKNDKPPTIDSSISCVPGSNGWCRGGDITVSASDPQGYDINVLVSSPGGACNGSGSCDTKLALPEGQGTVSYTVKSTSGKTASGSKAWKNDSVAPIVNIDFSGTSGSNGWYISATSVTVRGSDATSGLATLTSSFGGTTTVFSSDGIFNISAAASDTAGNSGASGKTLSIDTVPPSIGISVSGSIGNNGWYVTPADVVISGADATSGVGGITSSFGGASATLLDGLHNISGTVTDMAGHSSSDSTSLKVDTAPPAIIISASGTIGNNGWNVSPVDITVSGSDATSGLESISTSFGGNSTNLSSDGTYNISVDGKDNAGNVSSNTLTVKIDQTPPVLAPSISGSFVGGEYSPTVSIETNATDATSGVLLEEINVDEGGWVSPGVFTLTSGDHTIQFRAEDSAGNLKTSSQVITVDVSAPTVLINTPNQCGSDVTLTGTVSDNGIITDLNVNVDGTGNPVSFAGGNWAYSVDGLGTGKHAVGVSATDSAGNTNTASLIFNVDATPPTVAISKEWWADGFGKLSVKDNGKISKVKIVFSYQGKKIKTSFFSGRTYPELVNWGEQIPGFSAPYGDKIIVQVTAFDNCGNNGSGTGYMVVPYPTPTPINIPAPTPTKKAFIFFPPKGSTETPTVVDNPAEVAVLYSPPNFLWFLSALTAVAGVGFSCMDPRTKHIKRLSKAKLKSEDLFNDSFEI